MKYGNFVLCILKLVHTH